MIMLHLCVQNAAQVVVGQKYHEVQALAAQRAYEPYSVAELTRGSDHR
jgi:hypothetical protein